MPITVGPALVATALWPPLALIAAFAFLASAALVDVRERRLPDHLLGMAALPIAGLAAGGVAERRSDTVTSIVAGALLLAVPLLVLHLCSPAGMGFGDVKAGAALGGALGVVDPALSIWVLAGASAASLVWMAARRHGSVAFGASLVAAGVVSLPVALMRGAEAMAWR